MSRLVPGLFELLQCGQDVCRLGSDGRERRIVPAVCRGLVTR